MDESGQLDPSVDPQFEQVLSDYSRRVAAGESISPSDLISQNPAVADALRSHFASAGAGQEDTALGAADSISGTRYVRLSSQATIPPRKPAVAAALPECFGRYRIVRCLGRGAMGDVYLAEDTQLDRQVALKIPRFADDQDGELIERFYREARAAATVRHPNLCPVHDAGEIDGIHYLSMTYIEGRPLYDVLAEKGRPSQRDAATIVLKLAKALDAAHTSGVIHRDLKPANIMIDAHQEPILMDFGLARRTNKDDSRLTQSGLVMGSPAYMSPEQVEADIEKVGPACDIYSLGIIFYELLTGEVPFRGSIASVLGQIVTVAPRKPSAIVPKIDPALEAICLKMIAKRLEDRFASMREVAAALESHLAGRPTGITVPEHDRTAGDSHAVRIERHSGRGIVIAPWMLWTALVIIIAGFGVTWQLIAMMMKQQAGSGEIAIDQSTKDAFSRGDAHLWLNDKQLTREQLQKPIELPAGSNNVQIRNGAEIKRTDVIVSEKDDPTLLERTPDGRFVYTPLQRRVAKSILSQGGKLKLVGSEVTVARAPDLPQGRIRIEGIDLGGVASIPAEEIELIKKLAVSLKRLVLPKTGVSERQLDELRKALPDREINRASETP
jgi:predicted Ser/Thr protein kinase